MKKILIIALLFSLYSLISARTIWSPSIGKCDDVTATAYWQKLGDTNYKMNVNIKYKDTDIDASIPMTSDKDKIQLANEIYQNIFAAAENNALENSSVNKTVDAKIEDPLVCSSSICPVLTNETPTTKSYKIYLTVEASVKFKELFGYDDEYYFHGHLLFFIVGNLFINGDKCSFTWTKSYIESSNLNNGNKAELFTETPKTQKVYYFPQYISTNEVNAYLKSDYSIKESYLISSYNLKDEYVNAKDKNREDGIGTLGGSTSITHSGSDILISYGGYQPKYDVVKDLGNAFEIYAHDGFGIDPWGIYYNGDRASLQQYNQRTGNSTSLHFIPKKSSPNIDLILTYSRNWKNYDPTGRCTEVKIEKNAASVITSLTPVDGTDTACSTTDDGVDYFYSASCLDEKDKCIYIIGAPKSGKGIFLTKISYADGSLKTSESKLLACPNISYDNGRSFDVAYDSENNRIDFISTDGDSISQTSYSTNPKSINGEILSTDTAGDNLNFGLYKNNNQIQGFAFDNTGNILDNWNIKLPTDSDIYNSSIITTDGNLVCLTTQEDKTFKIYYATINKENKDIDFTVNAPLIADMGDCSLIHNFDSKLRDYNGTPIIYIIYSGLFDNESLHIQSYNFESKSWTNPQSISGTNHGKFPKFDITNGESDFDTRLAFNAGHIENDFIILSGNRNSSGGINFTSEFETEHSGKLTSLSCTSNKIAITYLGATYPRILLLKARSSNIEDVKYYSLGDVICNSGCFVDFSTYLAGVEVKDKGISSFLPQQFD